MPLAPDIDVISALRESEERFRVAFHTHPDAISIIRIADGRYVEVNEGFCRLTGYAPQEVIGRTSNEIGLWADPGDRERLAEIVQQYGHVEAFEAEFRLKDGRRVPGRVASNIIRLGGEPHVLSVTRSIEAERMLEAERARLLRQSESARRLLETVLERVTDGVVALDRDWRYTFLNPQAARMLDRRQPEDLIGRNIWEEFPEGVGQPFHQAYVEAMSTQRYTTLTEYYPPCDRWFESRIYPSPDGLTIFFTDVTEQRLQSERIRYLAFHDELTGLPNRSLCLRRLEQGLAGARRHRRPLALLYLDLDHFKEINDTLGHGAGDQALAIIGHRLLKVLREEETVARLGGDEFAVIAEGADQDAAMRIAERLREAVIDPVEFDGHAVSIDASIGVALYPNDAEAAGDLMRFADMAMYRAKAIRNAVAFYHPELETRFARKVDIAASLARALETGDQLRLHLQPQIELATGALSGAEALLRWEEPVLGTIAPSEFIPVAEERGMMETLGAWVLRRACRILLDWREAGLALPGRLAVNVSARQFGDADFARQAEAIVKEAGLAPELFELELTESALAEDPEAAVVMLRTLSDAGFALAIDDFGTGYSSLAYLGRFEVDRLKIDLSFVQRMLAHRQEQGLVTAIVAMARQLGLTTVAEGVETDAQADTLRRLGAGHAQGYLFGRPLPADAFARRWLAGDQDGQR